MGTTKPNVGTIFRRKHLHGLTGWLILRFAYAFVNILALGRFSFCFDSIPCFVFPLSFACAMPLASTVFCRCATLRYIAKPSYKCFIPLWPLCLTKLIYSFSPICPVTLGDWSYQNSVPCHLQNCYWANQSFLLYSISKPTLSRHIHVLCCRWMGSQFLLLRSVRGMWRAVMFNVNNDW